MIDYTGEEKKVQIGNRKFTAFCPEKHSRVKGIVYSYKRWDANAGDSYANIVRMKEYIVLYVMWKKSKSWEKIVDGSKNTSEYQLYSYRYGNIEPYNVAGVLFELETKEYQRKYRLKERKTKLKKQIKTKEREIKNIEKQLLKMK